MEVLVALFRENRAFVIAGVLLVLASALANVGTINFINQAIATEGDFIRDNMGFLLLLLAGAFGFGVSSQMIMTQLGYRVIYQMRGRLLQQVLNTDYEHLHRLGTNRIYAAITKDIRSLQDGFIMLPFFLYAAIMAIGGILYMFTLHLGLASIVLASIVTAAYIAKVLTQRFQTLIRKDRELEDQLFAQYSTVLDGHKELLLNEARGQRLLDLVMHGPALQSLQMRTLGDRYIVVNIHFMTTLILFQIALVFWLVYTMNWGGLAMATSFALTLMFIRQPLNMAMNQLGPILVARVSLQKLKSLKLGHDAKPAAVEEPLHWQTLQLHGVTYQYERDQSGFQLGPLNFALKRGELVFLAGHNGAGKTTLIRLVLGLLKPKAGQLLVDGRPLQDSDIRAYRHGFSAVLADFHLFEDLEELGRSQQEEVHEWLELLGLDEKVQFTEGHFSTTDLSTGQRKRLAMVGAVAEHRPVMILDEWAADQDPVFRQRFYFELLPKLKAQGVTLLVVSHDDRYFDVADRVLYLEGGKIIDSTSVNQQPMQPEVAI